MTQLTYSITREAASAYLWVSTRTIDRYVKSGKLSYKKVANKVILAKEQVDELKEEFAVLHQDGYETEIVSENRGGKERSNTEIQPMSTHNANSASLRQIDQKMDKFFTQKHCDRCGNDLSAGRTMSMYNEDCICMELEGWK